MTTVKQLRRLARDRKIKGYGKLNKAALLTKLGMSDELKSHRLGQGKGKAIDAQSRNIAKGSATQRAIIKGRLTRAVARDLKAAKANGKELSQDEKRSIALKAIAREAKNIRDGKKEDRPKRGGKPKPKFSIQSPPDGMSVAEYRAHLRRQHGAQTGTRTEVMRNKEERRAQIGTGESETRSQASRLREMERNGKVSYGESEKPKASENHAPQTGVPEQFIKNHVEMLRDISRLSDIPVDEAEARQEAIKLWHKQQAKIQAKQTTPTTRNAKSKPWAADNAIPAIQPRSQGYRPPGTTEKPKALIGLEKEPLDPQTVKQLEIGIAFADQTGRISGELAQSLKTMSPDKREAMHRAMVSDWVTHQGDVSGWLSRNYHRIVGGTIDQPKPRKQLEQEIEELTATVERQRETVKRRPVIEGYLVENEKRLKHLNAQLNATPTTRGAKSKSWKGDNALPQFQPRSEGYRPPGTTMRRRNID